jgi:PEP-CTERM motif
MGARHATYGAAAAVAVFSAVCRSTVALAEICPDVGSGAVSCTTNYPAIDVAIDQFPDTAIYNLVNNSVTLQEIHGGLGETPINIIASAPTTIIYNLIENTVNVHILGPAGTPISGSINGNPITTTYSSVDDSVNFSDLTDAPPPITYIESSPTTIIYDRVENGVNITPGLQDASSSSQSAVLLTPTSKSIVIDNEPVTELLNQVDNSVSVAETISTLTGTMVTVVKNIPTTKIFNVVDNTVDLWLSDPLGIPIDLSIDSMPNTSIENLVDNSVNVTVVPEPSSWSLLALGFCAFGLLRRATSKRAQGAKHHGLRVTTPATSRGSDALISSLPRQLGQDHLRQAL